MVFRKQRKRISTLGWSLLLTCLIFGEDPKCLSLSLLFGGRSCYRYRARSDCKSMVLLIKDSGDDWGEAID